MNRKDEYFKFSEVVLILYYFLTTVTKAVVVDIVSAWQVRTYYSFIF